jgi:hypothetical protein
VLAVASGTRCFWTGAVTSQHKVTFRKCSGGKSEVSVGKLNCQVSHNPYVSKENGTHIVVQHMRKIYFE